MLESAWLFVGTLAVLTTAVAVLTKTQGARLIPNDDAVAIYSGIAGFISWGIWTYGALDVEVAADAGVQTFNMPSVALFGVAMATIPAFIALTGPANVVRRAMDKPTADEL